jgi:PEGA domain
MLKRIFSVLTSVGAILFVVGATIVLVAFGRGYSYDFKNHRPTLNGLVIMSSTPASATVLQNHQDIKKKTPYRATLEVGSYDFEVRKDGYRSWSKRLDIDASQVTWAQYIWLLPETLRDQQVAVFDGASQIEPSRDHQHFAIVSTGPSAAVWVYDTGTRNVTKLYSPLLATADQPAESLVDVRWSDDNSHLLLRTKRADKQIVQIIAGGQAPLDLSASFRYDFASISFVPGNWRELFWISPEGLRHLDVGAQTVSAVLVENVVSYAYHGDRVLYVQTTKLGKSLSSMDRSGRDKRELVQSLAESDSYEIAEVTYRDRDLLAVLPAKSRTITLYTDISSDNPVSRVISKDSDHMLFNPDGRFLAYSSATASGVFDSEKTHAYQLKQPLVDYRWFDTYHLLGSVSGQTHFLEFDGQNDQTIGQSSSGLAAYATSDQRAFIRFITGSDGKLGLVTTDTHK